MNKIARRSFLVGLCGLGVGASFLLKYFIQRDKKVLDELVAFLRVNPASAELEKKLMEFISADTEQIEAEVLQRIADLRSSLDSLSAQNILDALLAADFKAGRVVEIDGWNLAEVEAKAYLYLLKVK